MQALTPYLAVALMPVVLIAMWRRQLLIVTVASAIGFGIGVLAAPLAFPDPQPPAAERSAELRVAPATSRIDPSGPNAARPT